ncbi:MAG: hypothetical protein Tsb0020_11410 [Haliangiales bacterium]
MFGVDKPRRACRFQAGGTLGDDAFYVERPADDRLPAALLRGELCYVLTSRQMGKSSLRVRAMKRLQSHGVACASIDLTGIGSTDITVRDWYYGLTSEIADQVGLDEPDSFWDQRRHLGPVHGLCRYLEEEVLARISGRIVIFIDEIDATLSLPFSRDDFFAAVRALYNRRVERPENQRLTFCLLGVSAPSDLIDDPTRTPFNIGRAIRLDDFTRAEMSILARGLSGIDANPHACLDKIFDWTHGHPYMTQRVCADLVAAVQAQIRRTGVITSSALEEVEEVIRTRFLAPKQIEDPNLQFAERRLGKRRDASRVITAHRILQLYRRLHRGEHILADASDRDQYELRLIGMAAERAHPGGRVLAVRNRIFQTVFDQAWIDRQVTGRAIAMPLARWLESERSDACVLRGPALAKIQTWAATRQDLTPDEQTFLSVCVRVASDHQRAAERRRATRVLATSIGLMVMMLSVILWKFQRARSIYSDTSSQLRTIVRIASRAQKAEAEARAAEARARWAEARAAAEAKRARVAEAQAKLAARWARAAESLANRTTRRMRKLHQRAKAEASRARLAEQQANFKAAQARASLRRAQQQLSAMDQLQHQRRPASDQNDGLIEVLK